MVLAYHVIFGAYGFWLPNDPRGSGSRYVASKPLLSFGPATRVETSRSVAARPHDRAKRLAAKQFLKYPPVTLTGIQARTISMGFKQACGEGKYVLHALSILPTHVHMVIARHERSIGRITGHLKTRALQQLSDADLWPDDHRPLWGDRGRHVFLDSHERVLAAIRYVERNPLKEGKRRQKWSFVVPYAGNVTSPRERRASSSAQ